MTAASSRCQDCCFGIRASIKIPRAETSPSCNLRWSLQTSARRSLEDSPSPTSLAARIPATRDFQRSAATPRTGVDVGPHGSWRLVSLAQ